MGKSAEDRLKEFYDNWYFYQEYKKQPHFKDAHKINYKQ